MTYHKNQLNITANEKLREKCGIFAICGYKGSLSAAYITYLGLLALQHRGQESAGMAYSNQENISVYKGMGLIENVFNHQKIDAITARTILGHVRYSTTGPSLIANAQPLVARTADKKGIALAHNGNLVNYRRLYHKLLDEGHIFHTTSDTEVLLFYIHLFRQAGLVEAVSKTMHIVKGAYAAVVTDGNRLIAFRDPGGFRPLVIGNLDDAFVVASETAALDTVNAQFIREVQPGEIVTLEPQGLTSVIAAGPPRSSFCIFEYIYFARPDSIFNGLNVHSIRREIGVLLARHYPPGMDMVIPVPDSGISAALGLAGALGLPLEWAIYRNSYLGRTFIKPGQNEREMAVRLKLSPIKDIVKGKKIIVVDDSLVRGTTCRILVQLLFAAGASEVHLCIASPPFKHPCYFGVDIPVTTELSACKGDNGNSSSAYGANSLIFAEPNDLYRASGLKKELLCSACFSGIYPDLD